MADSTAITNGHTTLTGSAQKLLAAGVTGEHVLVRNPTGNATFYLGTSTVTSGNGFPVYAGESLSIDLVSLGALYVIGTAVQELAWLVTN